MATKTPDAAISVFRLLAVALISVLLVGCSSAPPKPKYKSYWTHPTASGSEKEAIKLDCELKSFDARERYLQTHPNKYANARTYNERATMQLAEINRQNAADKFKSKALRSCLKTNGFELKSRCVKNCQ